MATWTRHLLSGSAVGATEALNDDGTVKTIHQTSTTSGHIEDVTVEITNPSAAAEPVNVRIEQDGTLKHDFDISIAAGATEKVCDQLTCAHNVDIKASWSKTFNGPEFDSVLWNNSSGAVVYSDVAYAATATSALNGGAINTSINWCVDKVNKVVVGLSSATANRLVVVDLLTGATLGTSTNGPSTWYQVSICPSEQKAVIYNADAAMVFDYSNPAAMTGTTVHTDLGSNSYPVSCNKFGMILHYTPASQIRCYAWSNLNSAAATLSSVSFSTGYVIGDPYGDGWCAWQIGTGSYNVAAGRFRGSSITNAQTSYNSSTYTSICLIENADPAVGDVSGSFWVIGTNSNTSIRQYTFGTTTATLTRSHPSSAYYGTNSPEPSQCQFGVDGTGDEILVWTGYDYSSSYYACAHNITDNTFAYEASPTAQGGRAIVYVEPKSAYGIKAPYFNGFANRYAP